MSSTFPIFLPNANRSSSNNNNNDSSSSSFLNYNRRTVFLKKCFDSATCISRRPAIKHHPTRRPAAASAASDPSSSYRVRRPIDYSVLDHIGMGGFAAAEARGQRKEEAEDADKKRYILCRHDQEQCV